MNARLSMHRSILASLACALGACGGATQSSLSGSATGEEAEALLAASQSGASYDAQAEQCAQTFLTCVSGASANVAACKSALETCLPATPPPPPGCDGAGDGGLPPPPPLGDDGGRPPPAPPRAAGQGDGGMRPPPPPPGGGPGDSGGAQGGPPPYCGKVPLPPPAALMACRKTLESCMQGATDDTERQACVEAERGCASAAFAAAAASPD
jgi:hypothetical protein